MKTILDIGRLNRCTCNLYLHQINVHALHRMDSAGEEIFNFIDDSVIVLGVTFYSSFRYNANATAICNIITNRNKVLKSLADSTWLAQWIDR